MFGVIGCPILTKINMFSAINSGIVFLSFSVDGGITISICIILYIHTHIYIYIYKILKEEIQKKHVGTYDQTDKIKRLQL